MYLIIHYEYDSWLLEQGLRCIGNISAIKWRISNIYINALYSILRHNTIETFYELFSQFSCITIFKKVNLFTSGSDSTIDDEKYSIISCIVISPDPIHPW